MYDDIILEKRDKKSYNKDTLKSIKLLSVNPDLSVIFGSAAYKMQPYPGDVDAAEIINSNMNMYNAIKYLEKQLKKIVKRIYDTDGYYITEIKTGLDKAFLNIDIGEIEEGRIVSYEPIKAKTRLTLLYKNGFLTKSEYIDFMSRLKDKVSLEELEELLIMERNKIILRWSAEEFIRGFKVLLPNRRITLNEALHDKTMVKIDMLAPINNKYIEVTNFFVLQYIDKNGKERFVNLDDDHFTNILGNLSKEVNKLYYNTHFYNPLKLAKRMWSMARIKKDMKMVNKLTPLLRSDAGLLAQLNSELETIILLYEKVNTLPYKIIYKQLDNMKNRISSVIDIPINDKKIIDRIDILISARLQNRRDIIYVLKEIKTYIKKRMIHYAEIYLKKHGLLPPPKDYLV